MYLSAIYIYPIKSCRGIERPEWEVSLRGLRDDRRWMVVDENRVAITQRDVPSLAAVEVSIDHGALIIRANSFVPLMVPHGAAEQESVSVRVWDDTVIAKRVGDTADRWFSDVLGRAAMLVEMPDGNARPIRSPHAASGDHVSFADGYPLLLATEASLEDLNRRMKEPVPMNRFRPNVVIAGSEAWKEDDWSTLRIGEVNFRAATPCARCVITTIDQSRGVSRGKEPLATLAAFRRSDKGVLFGMNLIPDQEGSIRVGDNVEVQR